MAAEREGRMSGGGGGAGFSAAMLAGAAALGAVLLIIALYAAVGSQKGRDPGDARAPSAKSVSAIGLRALADLMREHSGAVALDAGVWDQAGEATVILVSDTVDSGRLSDARWRYEGADAVLVILPKWRRGYRSFGRRFAREVRKVSVSEAQKALNDLIAELGYTDFEVFRSAGAFGRPALNAIGPTPEISDPQLMRGRALRPLIARPDGAMLLAEAAFENDRLPRLFILSDPDPVMNHGIDDGDNALFAVRLLERLGGAPPNLGFDDGPGAPVTPASFWASLFEPPLVAISIAVLALFAALGLIGLARFGPRLADRPGLAAGKALLLDAAAALLRQGEGDRAVIRRFFEETLRDVGARLQAPDLTDGEKLRDWLAQAERARRPHVGVESLSAEVAALSQGPRPRAERLTQLAGEINGWREEMLRGRR